MYNSFVSDGFEVPHGARYVLKEVPHSQQVPGEPQRRWYSDSRMDLIVWHSDSGEITGFQLCYDKSKNERALTWQEKSGFTHKRVDDGEIVGQKMTPILVPDGRFDAIKVAALFEKSAGGLDPCLKVFVLDRLARYPRRHPAGHEQPR